MTMRMISPGRSVEGSGADTAKVKRVRRIPLQFSPPRKTHTVIAPPRRRRPTKVVWDPQERGREAK